jgi:uncharacterized membrane protein
MERPNMDITPQHKNSVHLPTTTNLKQWLENSPWKFPTFHHDKHPAIINVNEVADSHITAGDRIADAVTATIGSWRFIIIQSLILATWIAINSIAAAYHLKWAWDPYPFILLNLALSFQAAYSAPFVMMSQNRQAAKDRLTAENDYQTDLKGEQEVCHIIDHMDHQDALILQIVQRLETENQRINDEEKLILELIQKMSEQQKIAKEQHAQILKLLGAAPSFDTIPEDAS